MILAARRRAVLLAAVTAAGTFTWQSQSALQLTEPIGHGSSQIFSFQRANG